MAGFLFRWSDLELLDDPISEKFYCVKVRQWKQGSNLSDVEGGGGGEGGGDDEEGNKVESGKFMITSTFLFKTCYMLYYLWGGKILYNIRRAIH